MGGQKNSGGVVAKSAFGNNSAAVVVLDRPVETPDEANALAAAVRNDPRWLAVRARDPKVDGTFFYAVRTTGVYCRPSCSARAPKRENVVFYPDIQSAETAGFRPCKRCHPLPRHPA